MKAVSLLLLCLSFAHARGLESYAVTVLKEFPHEGAPWIQGLEFTGDGKQLVEAVGAYPSDTHSFVRFIDPETGKTTKTVTEGFENVFLEGISAFQTEAGREHWLATTYTNKAVLELDENLEIVKQNPYPLEGWGLSRGVDGAHLLATDGSATLTTLDRATKSVSSTKVVECLGKQVKGVNELEYVENFMGQGPRLLGNVMNTRTILVMDPETAKCTGSFNLMEVSEPYEEDEKTGFHVANGIAYSKHKNTFFVTGKNWKKMFEISLAEETGDAGQSAELLSKHLSSAPAAGEADEEAKKKKAGEKDESKTTDAAAGPNEEAEKETAASSLAAVERASQKKPASGVLMRASLHSTGPLLRTQTTQL